jgi:hypothetical protein
VDDAMSLVGAVTGLDADEHVEMGGIFSLLGGAGSLAKNVNDGYRVEKENHLVLF